MSNVKHAMAQVRNQRGEKSLAAQLTQLGFGQVDATVSRLDPWRGLDNGSFSAGQTTPFDWNSAVRGAIVWR